MLPWVLLRYLYDEPTCIRLLDSRWSKAVEPVTKRVGYLSGKIRGQIVTVLDEHWRQEHHLLVFSLNPTESYWVQLLQHIVTKH